MAGAFDLLPSKDRRFQRSGGNLPIALPAGRELLIGKFDTAGLWRDASFDLQSVTKQWFTAKEGGTDSRNALLGQWLGKKTLDLGHLVDKVIRLQNREGCEKGMNLGAVLSFCLLNNHRVSSRATPSGTRP